MLNRHLPFLMRSAVHDGGGAPAPVEGGAPAEPTITDVQFGADGAIQLYEDAPAAAPAPAAPAPGSAPFTVDDWLKVQSAQQQQNQPAPTPEPAPVFDATKYVVPDGDDAGSIDMKGLSMGVNEFVQQAVQRAVGQTAQAFEQRYGGSVQSLAVRNTAADIAKANGLGDVGRDAIAEHLSDLDPQVLRNIHNDKRAMELIVGAAERRERNLAAKDQVPATPGGGGRRPSSELRWADGSSTGWQDYCRVRGWQPNDPVRIREAKAKGLLK